VGVYLLFGAGLHGVHRESFIGTGMVPCMYIYIYIYKRERERESRRRRRKKERKKERKKKSNTYF